MPPPEFSEGRLGGQSSQAEGSRKQNTHFRPEGSSGRHVHHPNTEPYLEKPLELPTSSQKFFLVSSWPFCLTCAKVRICR